MEGECARCGEFMRQLTAYRDQAIAEKEALRKEVEKCKQQLEKFMGKIDKRVDSRIQEERQVNNHHLERLQQFHQQELSKMQTLMEQKDKLLEQMRQVLRESEREKKELIQTNTKILVQMGGQLGGDKQEKDRSYWELMKMYQFLIEQNNQLKKDVYLLRKENVNAQQKEKSILDSAQKLKSPTIHTSKDAFNTSKSFKQEGKDKKKIPKSRAPHK